MALVALYKRKDNAREDLIVGKRKLEGKRSISCVAGLHCWRLGGVPRWNESGGRAPILEFLACYPE